MSLDCGDEREYRRIRGRHLAIGIPAYVVCGALDVHFTLVGMDGDPTLEGSGVMRAMMATFGTVSGLIIEKALVLAAAIALALIAGAGIQRRAAWVYSLALTPMTRAWMRRRRRHWIAYLPLHLAALAQGLAAGTWVYLIFIYQP